MKTVKMSFAASLTYKPQFPERTARRSHHGLDMDVTYQTWPSRAAMLKTIEMQSSREPHHTDWRPCFRG